jgi:hypothetical protein
MANLNGHGEGSSSAQPLRTSTIGADYLNTRQLFSQTDESQNQTGDAGCVAEEQRIQRAFLTATEKHKNKDSRRVTFTEAADEEVTSPEDGDELQTDDLNVSQTITNILAKLDEGAEQFASEVQKRPNYVYNLTGKLCSQLHLLKETNELLHQSNTINNTMRERIATQHMASQESLQAATEKITELTEKIANQEENPGSDQRTTAQLHIVTEKNDWYGKKVKGLEATLDGLNSEVADFATANEELTVECDRLQGEHDTLRGEHERLQGELSAANEHAARGRSLVRKSVSPWTRDHTANEGRPTENMAPPSLPKSRTALLHTRSRALSELRTTDDPSRFDRELTALTNASQTSVNLDPNASMPVKVDRSINNPDKFDGKQGTFYQWLTTLTFKLSTCQFRTEADGLRYVQGFLTGAPWQLVAPRIPTLGGWGKPCPNPFEDVDTMMKLLAERYGEDNTEERAYTAMVALKQADREDFNIFYAKYQEYQVYCPMTDKLEVRRLQGKLNSRFRNKLADGMDIGSLKELVSRCNRLQTQWESMDAEAAITRQPRSQPKNRDRRSKTDDAPASTAGANTKTGLYRLTLPDSELPREYRNMPPLTAEVRQTLRDAGGCYKCRTPGHTGSQRDKCPLAILEDAYEKRTSKVNQVQVEDAPEQHSSENGIATR